MNLINFNVIALNLRSTVQITPYPKGKLRAIAIIYCILLRSE